MILSTPQDVLIFWFSSLDQNIISSIDYINDHMGIWFGGKSSDFDQVQKDNILLINYLSQKEEDLSSEWLTPEGYLARVIVLDQFTRCVFRGTKDAFKYDEISSKLVQEVLNKGWFTTNYLPIQRFFFGIAIQHSENLEMQTIGVELSKLLALDASNEIQQFFANLKGYPHEHYDVIQKFGRFPSRNLALGRESTQEELDWMNSPDCPTWARTQIPEKIIRVGIISFGLSGRVFHCPFILTHPKFKLVAVYERSKNEAEEYLRQHNILNSIITVRNLEDLINRNDIDLIVVCSPIEYHFEHAQLSLLAGKHVLVEKAFCALSSQAQELLDLAKSKNLICMPYQNRRYDSDFRTIRYNILHQLGDIVEYNGYYNRFSPTIRNVWKDTIPNSGGNFLSLGSHMIDQAVLLFGIPTSIWADIRVQREGGILDDAWEVHLFYERNNNSGDNNENNIDYLNYGGFRAILKGSLLCPNHKLRYMIHGKNGSWIKNGVDTQEEYLMKGNLPDYNASKVIDYDTLEKYLDSSSSSSSSSTTTTTLPYGCEESKNWGSLTLSNGIQSNIQSLPGSYHLLYDELYNCIVKNEAPSVDPYLSVVVLKVIELARESSKTKKVIQWE